MIPAWTITYAETRTVTHILDVQADYVNGTMIQTEPLNQSAIIDVWGIATIIGESATNDSGLYGYKATGTPSLRHSVYWGDFQTYIGNGTYNMNINTSLVPMVTYVARNCMVELETNNSEWLTYDFVKLYTNYTGYFGLYFQTDALGSIVPLQPIALTLDDYICIPVFSFRNQIESYPDGKIWVVFEIDETTDGNVYTDFNIQGFTLTPSDAFTWDDAQIYVLTLLGCDIILIVGFAFTTNFIDIAIDHSKPRKPRKNR